MPFDILFTPIQIGPKTAVNRLVNQPMESNDADERGKPTELTFDRYRRLAEGGAGMIIVESLTILSRSRARKNQLEITERNAEGLARLVGEMRAINDQSLIIFQINHSGNISNGSFSEGFPTTRQAIRKLGFYPTKMLMKLKNHLCKQPSSPGRQAPTVSTLSIVTVIGAVSC